MTRPWTVVKIWHVDAEKADEAIAATWTTQHSDVRTSPNGPFDWLSLQRDEIDVLLACVAGAIPDWQLIRDVGQAEETRRVAMERWMMLNSLRTYLTEARWRLMTPEQIAEERAELQAAREAGVILSALPTLCRHCRDVIEDAEDLAEGQQVTCVMCAKAGRADRG